MIALSFLPAAMTGADANRIRRIDPTGETIDFDLDEQFL
jgi:hypothetical protein